MNIRSIYTVTAALLLTPAFYAMAQQPAPEPPPPVMQAPAQLPPAATRIENQRLYGPASPSLVPADQATALVEKFRALYEKLGAPRILFYVNRELVDTTSGMKLAGRTERYENHRVQSGSAATDTTKTSGDNTYAFKEPAKNTLADRQTVREIERLFGRTFRAAGAALADQKIAADLIADKPLGNLAGTSDQASKDREALAKVADVVVEVLLSSRSISAPAVSGDQTLNVPDIQATVIRLKDAAILAQAAASDVLGRDREAGNLARTFDVREVTEATALALMEDWMGSVK